MKIQRHHRRREFGFSLVEIVVALAIVGVMIAISVPSIDSIRKEKLAREPVTALAKMVRETRKRAMSEGRPYQIAFDSRGFHAARFFSPYGKSEEFDQLQRDLEVIAQEQEIIEASRARGIDLNAGAGPTEAQQQMEDGKKVENPMEVIRSSTSKAAKNTGAFAPGFRLPGGEEEKEN